MLEPPGEQLDMGPTYVKQRYLLSMTPHRVVAQILLTRQPGVPGIARQEPTQRQLHLEIVIDKTTNAAAERPISCLPTHVEKHQPAQTPTQPAR
ncbi:MAG: hypothetical protein IH850_12110 [Acidobacteria bacterium]|nr:hypothetical protein [Acidobacteriota bacterium]